MSKKKLFISLKANNSCEIITVLIRVLFIWHRFFYFNQLLLLIQFRKQVQINKTNITFLRYWYQNNCRKYHLNIRIMHLWTPKALNRINFLFFKILIKVSKFKTITYIEKCYEIKKKNNFIFKKHLNIINLKNEHRIFLKNQLLIKTTNNKRANLKEAELILLNLSCSSYNQKCHKY